MRQTAVSRSATIRDRLDHPVVDADGHVIGFLPDALDALRDVGGPKVVERFLAAVLEDERSPLNASWYRLSPDERRRRRVPRPAWWTQPTRNTLDQATAILPSLLYERLGELGIDFAVSYAGLGLLSLHMDDEEVRRASCRAFNLHLAETFRPYSDRMTPAAVVPMHTPEEAIDELEHAVTVLGLKVVLIAGYVQRPIEAAVARDPSLARHATWMDTFGIDSEHDYDPFWRRCAELRVSPTTHSVGMGWGSRRSISNYMYNHIGHFAAVHEALAKSLLMGGVTRRFPGLSFAFLEGGVGWACSLYADSIDRWKKRNRKDLDRYDPAETDPAALLALLVEHGGPSVAARLREHGLAALGPLGASKEDPATLDEWAACEISRPEDFSDLFAERFYFGCESEDPMVSVAFDSRLNHFGARLRAMWGSDVGHWDVPEMRDVLAEAWEQVEDRRLDEDQFRDFVFANPVRCFTDTNPDFFAGTAIEREAAQLVAAEARSGAR